MSDTIQIDGKQFISANSASEFLGVSRDYVGRLCREGKISGRRIGVNWYVEQASLKEFLIRHEYDKSARREELSKIRISEYAQSQPTTASRNAPAQTSTIDTPERTSVIQIQKPNFEPTKIVPAFTSTVRTLSQDAARARDSSAVYQKLSAAVAQQSIRMNHSMGSLVSSSGVGDAALRIGAQSAAHVPIFAVSPVTEFMHKLVALTLACMLTFGTYALVDQQTARVAVQSVLDAQQSLLSTYESVTGGGISKFAERTQASVALAVENPKASLAAASFSIGLFVPEVAAKIARVVNAHVDRWVYAVSFPQELVQSLGIVAGDDSGGSVSVQVQPYARQQTSVVNTATVQRVQSTTADTGATTIITQPVIERVIETERIVTSGGITESELTDKLNQLNNRLVAQIYSQTSAISSPIATGGIVNNFAGSQRIDRLSGTTITGGTITGAAISGGSISGVSLSAGDLSGTVGIANGGTGTSTAPSYGELLVGDGNGGYSIAATSTLGLSPSSLLSTANTWTALQIFSASASSTDFSNTGTAYFGGTATTTIDSAGNIFAAGTLSVTNLASFTLASTSQLSVFDRAYFGGTATSTFDSTGFLTLPSGFLSQASSTIGDGTQAGGLTISGGATTTGDFVISKASAPTTGNLYFGNGTANINYNSSDFTFTGGSLYTAAGRITSVGLNESTGVGVRYVSGDGTYYIGATHSASPDFVFTNNGNLERARLTDAGSFGIGTTTPWAKLAISANNGDTNARLFDISSSTASATSSLFTVLNTGNVGIGTTSPWKMLSVAGDIIGTNITATGTITTAGLTNTGTFSQTGLASFSIASTSQLSVFEKAYFGGTATTTIDNAGNVLAAGTLNVTGLTTLGNASTTQISSSALSWFNGGFLALASTTIGDGTATGGLTISGGATTTGDAYFAGNVGIGTSLPGAALEVNGSIIPTLHLASADSLGSTLHYWGNTYTNDIFLYNGGGVGISTAGSDFNFLTNSSSASRLFIQNSSGNVGIGTTSPYAKLSVVGPVVAEYFHATSTTATSTFAGGSMFGTNRLVILQNGNIGVGTAAPTTGFDVGVNTRITGDLTVGGGSSVTFSNTGPINQSGTGQVTFAGNVDATNGLDVTTANFTVGGSNFIVAPGTGNTTVAGTLGLTGALAASSTFQLTGAARFYSTLQTDGALTAAAAGTGLSVTNNASIGGTLGVTGLGTFSNGLTIAAGTLSAGAANFTGEVSIGSNKIVGLASPTADTDAANKIYVDSVAQGLTLKDSVRAGTTANITISGEQTIDGVSLVTGDRVLVKDQSDQTKNGIYVVSSGSWSRSTDADADSEVSSGLFTFISEGTANSNSGWVLTTANPITLGTSLLSFTQFSGAGQIIAGTGISKSGNTLDVGGTADRITANADTIDIASTYVGQSSITTVGTLTSGSLGTGFGNINIGASSITGGVATFSSIVGSAINGTGDLTISGTGTFSNGLTISAGTLSAGAATFSSNVALGGNKITGLADPTSAQEAATKAYVDAVAQGLTVKASVRAGTTANITLSGEQTIDGVAIVAGDRVLVKDQSTGSQNGIYVASAGAWSRATDMNENSEAVSGVYTFLTEGTAQGNTGWSLITPNVITLDTTSLTFTQFSGSAETTAGDGLTKTGNTINVVGTADRITVTSDAIDIAATYSGQSSILTVGTLTSGAIGSGFGAINIGSSALTAGAATFASAKSFGSLLVGGTATTTISGDSATSTFSGGISLAGGNVNLATGGNFLINNVLALNATSLGANVVSSSLTSVGALDSGSITTGFGDINIGANTLDAGTTTITNLAVTNTSASTFAGGLLVLASSTIGDGTQAGGLTISGGATTTDNAYFGGFATLGVNNKYIQGTNISGVATNILGIDTVNYTRLISGGAGIQFINGAQSVKLATLLNTGNFGVGTTSPWAKLSIHANNGETNTALFNIASSTASATSSLFTVLNTGRVGINTASPSNALDVTGDSSGSNIRVTYNSSSGNVGLIANRNATSNNASLTFQTAGTAIWKTGLNNATLGTSGSDYSILDGNNNNRLTILNSNGYIGIGTTTPNQTLDVVNSGTYQGAFANSSSLSNPLQLGADTNGFARISGAAGLALLTNSNEAVRIDVSGNVGVGTTSPFTKFSVAGSAYIGGNITATGTLAVTGTTGTSTIASGQGFTVGSSQFVVQQGSGNVGIGASNPGSKLEVDGDIYVLGGGIGYQPTNNNFTVGSTATPHYGMTWGTGNFNAGGGYGTNISGYNGIALFTTGTDRLHVTAAGNVGIGTTTPNAKLSVYGDIFAEGSNRYLNFGTVQGTSGYGFRDNAGTIEFKQLSGDWAVVGSGNDAWTHPAAGQSATTSLMLFSGGASSTIFSNVGTAYFGGTATSTFDSTGALSLVSNGLTVGTSQLVVSSGNVGIGTTTPNRLLTLSNSGATSQLLFEDTGASVDQHYFSLGTSRGGFTLNSLTDALATTTRFTVDSSGNVGVGTTSPFRKLSVTDTVSSAQLAVAYDATRYSTFQTDASGDLVIHPSGNDAFLNDDNLWVCTGGSCPAGTPSGTGNLVVENKLGVGTSSPTGVLAVTMTANDDSSAPKFFADAASSGQSAEIFIGQSLANYRAGGIRYINGAGTAANARFAFFNYGDTETLSIVGGGNVGIGTTSPSAQLATAGLIFVGGNGATTLGTATSTFYGDIKIAGKLDVGTIDPVYTIDGTKFATYGHSTIGIHEETLKTIQLTEQDESGKYSYTIDFDAQEKGSDLWLFYQITDFGSEWKSLVVSLTPSFDGTVFYKKVPEKKQLIVYADAPGEVSMRLSGNRFDFSKWPNLRTDQDGDTTGTHIISSKK